MEHEHQWDREEQIRKNQPLMKLIQEWRSPKNSQFATEEDKQEFLEIQESLKRKPFTPTN
jgi:hypothetical protein